MLYPVIVLIVLAISAVRGFRSGMARQTPSIIGAAFGIICTRLLAPGLVPAISSAFSSLQGRPESTFIYDTLSTSILFLSIFGIFVLVTSFLGKVFENEDKNILDNLGGAVFCMFKYALIVSIILNLLVAMNPRSELVRLARADDGNTVLEIMLLSPTLLGGQDVQELYHILQLDEAKKIS